jgi:hypothetical protein
MANRLRRGPREFVSFSARSIARFTIDQPEFASRRKAFSRPQAVVMFPFVVVLAVAVRTMIVGSTSWEAVLFSRYYVQLFVLVVAGIPTFRALWREYDEYAFVGMLLLGVGIGMTAGLLSPGHETSFCYAGRRMLYESSRVRIPDVFRCTTVLWGIPSALVFWWIIIIRRRNASQD